MILIPNDFRFQHKTWRQASDPIIRDYGAAYVTVISYGVLLVADCVASSVAGFWREQNATAFLAVVSSNKISR